MPDAEPALERRPGSRPRWRAPQAIVCFAGAAVLAFGARDARAQTAPPEVSAGTAQGAAEALFVEGKRLMAAGAYPGACAKFAESQRLDPAAGTLLNLADCYEKNGQLASAWIAFREATTAAERLGRAAWADQATARARLLEPRLPTLTVAIDPTSSPTGMEVSRDGVPVARSTWGVPVPVDPSTSRIEARAPDKKVWTTTVTVDAEHSHVVVAVPVLEDLPAPLGAAARQEPRPPFQWTAQRVAAVSSVAAGVIGLGISGGLALAAKGEHNNARGESQPAAMNDSADAAREGNVATAMVIGGAVATVAGLVLWFTAPRARARVTLGGPGLVLGGSF